MRLTLTAIRLTQHTPAHITDSVPLVWGAKVTKAKPQGVVKETHGAMEEMGRTGGERRKKKKEISKLIKSQTSYISNKPKY